MQVFINWHSGIIEDYVSVTTVVGAAFGREQSVAAQFAGKARSYGCHAYW